MQSTWNSHRTPQTTYKDFPDCLGRINCRQDSHASGTVGALQDSDRENAVQKLSPRIIPRAGWSMLPGRTSHFREKINCPRRFCETAGMPDKLEIWHYEDAGKPGTWGDFDGDPLTVRHDPGLRRLRVRPNTVIDWWCRFERKGPAGSLDRPRSGKPVHYGTDFHKHELELLEESTGSFSSRIALRPGGRGIAASPLAPS